MDLTPPPAPPSTHWGDLTISARQPAIIAPMLTRGFTSGDFLHDDAAPARHAIQELVCAWRGGEIDAIEWRIDSLCEDDGCEPEDLASHVRTVGEVLERAIPDGLPILATVRSTEEAGTNIAQEHTEPALDAVIDGACARVKAIDIEWSHPRRNALLAAARSAGLSVVASAHFFAGPIGATRMRALWQEMARAGGAGTAEGAGRADGAVEGSWLIGKIAIMPRDRADVDELMGLARDMATGVGVSAGASARAPGASTAGVGDADSIPVIAIAMGELGQASRVDGPRFGSCASFATVGQASAPGQMPAARLAALWVERGWRSAGPR